MRVATVIGTVTLSRSHPGYAGARLRAVVPWSLENFSGEPLGTELLVAWDQLGAGVGSRIAISEGPEAAMPFRPEIKCVDTCNSAILDSLSCDPSLIGNPTNPRTYP